MATRGVSDRSPAVVSGLVSLLSLLAACRSTDHAATLAVTRDSAGIRIVENPASVDGAPDAVIVPATSPIARRVGRGSATARSSRRRPRP